VVLPDPPFCEANANTRMLSLFTVFRCDRVAGKT
jgi:hypothetical protein